MKLSLRLQTIASFLDDDDIISDIGTDHGLIPIYHLLNHTSKKAYALDINANPLMQAKKNIDYYKVNVITVLSDGIENIYDDTNTLIIAGMGNNTIIDILTKYPNKLKNINKIVVQSNTYQHTIRLLLNQLGFKLNNEKVVYDHKKYYEIDCFIKDKEELTDLEIKYGKINLINRDEVFLNKLRNDLKVKENIYLKSKDESLLKEINEIKSILS